MDMLCYQCEQTAKGTGCTRAGRVRQGPADRRLAGSAGLCGQGHRPLRASGRPIGGEGS